MPSPQAITVHWPNGRTSEVQAGGDWLVEARSAGVSIPTGCLGGSCGACEIEVNGELLRACISSVPSGNATLKVEFASDPHW